MCSSNKKRRKKDFRNTQKNCYFIESMFAAGRQEQAEMTRIGTCIVEVDELLAHFLIQKNKAGRIQGA